MALAPTSSSSRGLARPEKILEDAVQEFQSILTRDQHTEFLKTKAVPDADAVMVFTAQLDRFSRSKKGRSIASRLYAVLQSVREFSIIIDTFVSAHPDIAALVWGSVKITMLIAVNAASYFEPLSNLFMGLNRHCPRFGEYQALYPTSIRLQKALCNFHAAIVRCCKHAVEVIQRPWQRQLANVLWQSFEMEFKPHVDAIQECGDEVKAEVALAKAQADHQDQELQKKEREAASGSRWALKGFMSKAADGIDTMKEQHLHRDMRRAMKQKQLLLDKLSSHDYLGPLREARKKRLCNTGEWIPSTSQFKRWINTSSSSLLWCSGTLGSGKTILAASAIEHVFANKKSTKDESVAFFFIRYDDPQSLKAETVLRSVIRQSLDPVTLSKEIEASLKELDEKLCPSLGDLASLLRQRVALSKSFYLFIDALDEYEPKERRDLLDALSLIFNVASGLKLFLAGRESLSAELRRRFPVIEHISTKSAQANSDMSVYVEGALLERIQTQELVIDESLYQELKLIITRRADGMFLWVTYLIDDLCSHCCEADIRKALGKLPRTLEETFDRALTRIVSRRKDKIAQRIFPWVAVAKRNLTLDELRDAISIEIGQQFSKPETVVKDIKNVVAWCENLLHVDEETKTVQFAHRTIHDYLSTGHPKTQQLAKFHVDIKEGDHHAGEICVTYLHFNDFKRTLNQRPQPIPLPSPGSIAHAALKARRLESSGLRFLGLGSGHTSSDIKIDQASAFASYKRAGPDEVVSQLNLGHPFLKYAARFWIEHTAGFRDGRSVTWGLWRAMVTDGHDLAQTPWPDHNFDSCLAQMFHWGCQALHYALVSFVCSSERMSQGEIGSAMTQSAAKGNVELLSLLLQFRDKVSVSHLEETLREASRHGQVQIIERLLLAGVNVNARDELKDRAALQAPSQGGRESVIRLGAELNGSLVDEIGQTALQAATEGGHLEAVGLLLANGADVNAAPAIINGLTALQAASESGHLELCKLLLVNGADVNATPACINGRTALQAAAEGGHLEVVERLLFEGADVDAAPCLQGGRTALQAASEEGHLEVVQRLLVAGAHVDAVSAFSGGLNALQAASGKGHIRVVERLLAGGANVNAAPAGEGAVTALQAASRGGHLEVVERLLSSGADVDAAYEINGGLSAAEEALRAGHLHVVERLGRATTMAQVDCDSLEGLSL